MSLFVRLSRAADPNNTERHTWKVEDEGGAVVSHLRRMLTTKAGGAKTCPDYGVPDITHLLHDMSEAIATVQRAVKQSIQVYEPRLKNVQVRPMKIDVAGQTGMLFEITGHIIAADGRRQPLRFTTAMDDKCQLTVEEI
jgi:type VI secretion system protein